MLGSVRLEQPASTLVLRGSLLAAQNTDGSIGLFDATQPAALVPIGGQSTPGCFWSNLKFSDGDLDRGLWMPMGLFGVNRIQPIPHP